MPQSQQPPYQQQMPLTLPPNATTAQQRAAQHLHQNYGHRAAASINAIQGGGPSSQQQQQQQMAQQQAQMRAQQQQNGQGMTMQQQQHMMAQRQNQAMMQAGRGMQQPGNGAGINGSGMTETQYRQVMAQNMAQQMQQANGRNGVGNAQTDGAGDEVESLNVIKRFNSAGDEISMGRIEIDGLIRSKIESMGTSMEGGGLMLPLHKASTPSKRQRKVKKSAAMMQTDGPDDSDDKEGVKDEEFDEDAINSDLDDPDDGLNDEEDEDEGMGHIMLCMYDKVQRVKNKWYVSLSLVLTVPELERWGLMVLQEVRDERRRAHGQWPRIRVP